MYNPFSLENKVILITGSSSGLGRAIAVEASKLGASLILMGRNRDRLEETLNLCEDRNVHKIFSIDLNNALEIDAFVSQLDKLDGVVNSAGIANTQLFNFLKEDSLKEMMATNFFSPILFLQKLFKKKKLNQNSSIVLLSSIAGTTITNYGYSSYAASKSAITGIAKTMALELASKKIRVNCLLPGMVKTALFNSIDSTAEDLIKDELNYPLGYGEPNDVAYAAIYLLSSASKWVTGTDLKLDGGFTIR